MSKRQKVAGYCEVDVHFQDAERLTLRVSNDATFGQLRQQIASESGRSVRELFNTEAGNEDALCESDQIGGADRLSLVALYECAGPVVLAESLGEHCNDAALVDFFNAESSATLTSLSLSGCTQLSPTGMSGVQVLPCLTHLSLHGCKMHEDSAAYLSVLVGLLQAGRLVSLDLSLTTALGDEQEANVKFASALKENTTLKQLNMASNGLYGSELVMLLEATQDHPRLECLDLSDQDSFDDQESDLEAIKGAFPKCGSSLSSLNLLGNFYEDAKVAEELVSIRQGSPNLRSLCGLTAAETKLDVSKRGLGTADAVLLASEIQDSCVMSSLTFGGACYDGSRNEGRVISIDIDMTEADFSKAHLGDLGAACLAAFMSRKNFLHGALSSLNLLSNNMGVPAARGIVEIKEAHPRLGTICGSVLEKTELDFSNMNLLAGDAVLLASDIQDNQALLSLDISNNSLAMDVESDHDIAGVTILFKTFASLKAINIASNSLEASSAQIFAGSVLLKEHCVLQSLDFSSNCLGSSGVKHIAEALAQW
jgi:hypothetical protein